MRNERDKSKTLQSTVYQKVINDNTLDDKSCFKESQTVIEIVDTLNKALRNERDKSKSLQSTVYQKVKETGLLNDDDKKSITEIVDPLTQTMQSQQGQNEMISIQDLNKALMNERDKSKTLQSTVYQKVKETGLLNDDNDKNSIIEIVETLTQTMQNQQCQSKTLIQGQSEMISKLQHELNLTQKNATELQEHEDFENELYMMLNTRIKPSTPSHGYDKRQKIIGNVESLLKFLQLNADDTSDQRRQRKSKQKRKRDTSEESSKIAKV